MSAQRIDLSRYPRRSHFEYFRSMAYPYVGLTVQADVTELRRAAAARKGSFFLACLYCAARAANGVPELRQRIVDGEIFQYDHCDTSHTVALPDGTYCYCRLDCRTDFDSFLSRGRAAQEAAMQTHGIDDAGDETELFFVSCLPWVTYTAMVQPVPCPADSNPRITFGRFREENGKSLMPLSLLAHHGLVDGLHMARFFEGFQEEIRRLRPQGTSDQI
ncbi:MAG: CatA-like O-acetyltransferase [Candidatus Faecousia sp.]|nr:CatA-like O-acetyltransferase [Bacillota bacterium]MDY4219521.1 CatA-like O-acetyltransferase [Candidatus Faecousia sp.]